MDSMFCTGRITDGDLLYEKRKPLQWKGSIPFGFNSWAGLAFRLNEDNYRKTAAFLREELHPAGYQSGGATYANLDAGWSAIPEEHLPMIVKALHAKGQKAGIYDAPFAFFGEDPEEEIPGAPGHVYAEILLKDTCGKPLPRVDGAIPYDVTHPIWQQQMRWKLDRFVKWDFDYVKLDFMSHGGMEGCHYAEDVRTGRQAITRGYELLTDFLSEEKIGKPFFISLSIAPLFPCGYGHARRFSCDAFGTDEDVEYVLNAQTYAWWQSGRLYQYNDPDHICLLRSFCMERDSTEGEARARYTSAVTAGTVMMLSDDYENPAARERALRFAGNRRINELAAKGIAFCPAESAGSSAATVYTANVDGRQYASKRGKMSGWIVGAQASVQDEDTGNCGAAWNLVTKRGKSAGRRKAVMRWFWKRYKKLKRQTVVSTMVKPFIRLFNHIHRKFTFQSKK